MRKKAAPKVYEGGCHCGALTFGYETTLSPRRWSVRACQCRFCRSHGAVMTSDPKGLLRLVYVQPDRLRRYRFAHRTADFLLCRECGVFLGAVLLGGNGAVAAINLSALIEPPPRLAQPRRVNYRAETADDRRGRRAASWTPVFGPV
ncbi:MAG: aldehyde-activating protein [Gammaproteobacteria bacterium]|nr:aldehyde-activating protein [Gammaproteobacteria bacterium]